MIAVLIVSLSSFLASSASVKRRHVHQLRRQQAHGVLHDREAILDDDVVAIGLCELYRSLEKCQVWASN